jgi:hypothetical protein
MVGSYAVANGALEPHKPARCSPGALIARFTS